MTETPRALAPALLAIRLGLAAMFAVWVADKLLSVETAQRVFSTFYFAAPPKEAIWALGIAQGVIVLAFAAGFLRTFSYGAILLMHSVSTIATYERLLEPLARPNILFWAAVPVLGAALALFLLRRYDVLLSLDAMTGRKRRA